MNGLKTILPEIMNFGYHLFVCLSSTGNLCFVNRIALEMIGYSENDVMGKEWIKYFVCDTERDLVAGSIKKLANSRHGTETKIECFLEVPGGDKLRIEWTCKVVNQKPTGKAIWLWGRDVTERTVLLNQIAQLEIKRRNEVMTSIVDAQERERVGIAMELHDNIGQLLTTCKLLLESELSATTQYPSIKTTYNYLQKAIDEVRSISQQLNPSHIKDLGFEKAVEELVAHFRLLAGITTHYTIHGRDRLATVSSTLQLCVYRMVQEQFNNIMKYAEASEVTLFINIADRYLDVEISDNGKGFDLSQVKKGNGIRNIYTRAELHHGTVYINTAPSNGCTVSICMPLQNE